MCNQQKTNHGKTQTGIENSNEFLKALMANNLPKFEVKVHSITDVDFVLSTPFAAYKIPRSSVVTFVNASEEELKNVIMSKVQTAQFECGYAYTFYWSDLDDMLDAPRLDKFKIDA